MKEKILAALQQEYPRLGLDKETFEGVASAVETLIKDESEIPNFVKGAEVMLKRYQSIADTARGEAARAKKELEDLKAKAKPEPDPERETKPEPQPQDIAKLISEAVSAAVKPFKDELDVMKAGQATKAAVSAAHDRFFENDYTKKFTFERDDAWERAVEYNELGGSKMSTDELYNQAMTYFNKYVSRKGVDTSKPFKSEGEDNGTTDWSAERKRKQEQGLIASDTKD